MKFLGYTIALLALALTTSLANAGALTTYTGPSGTNPVANAITQPDINALVNAINGMIGPGLTSGANSTGVTPGSVGGLFTSGSLTGTFQSQGLLQATNNILTTGIECIRSTTSGGCGTFSFFLTFVDSQGNQSFIPVYK